MLPGRLAQKYMDRSGIITRALQANYINAFLLIKFHFCNKIISCLQMLDVFRF